MNRTLFAISFSSLFLACGGYAADGLDNSDDGITTEIISDFGQLQQGVGVKLGTGTHQGFGSIEISGQPHKHSRCPSSEFGLRCSVPRTKSPTYFLQGLTAHEKDLVHNAFNVIDAQTNWTITETTDSASATITVNPLTCTGDDIQRDVCVNFTAQGNTLAEVSPIPNSWTEHTKGVIHIDRAALLDEDTVAVERDRIALHGLQAALGSWMGLGLSGIESPSPMRRFVHHPDDTTTLSAAEVCKLDGFRAAGQLATPTSIQFYATCTGD